MTDMAFPLPAQYSPHNGNCVDGVQYGMTLRDYFAAHALAALSPWTTETPLDIATSAFAVADAMMAQRGTP